MSEICWDTYRVCDLFSVVLLYRNSTGVNIKIFIMMIHKNMKVHILSCVPVPRFSIVSMFEPYIPTRIWILYLHIKIYGVTMICWMVDWKPF